MISIVIPAYNEEESISPLYREISLVMNKLRSAHEIIFIDDGSKDSTLKEIKRLSQKDKRVHYIAFQRNFGKSAALAAGFDKAKGDYIVMMDADLQDNPFEIPKMIQAMRTYDMAVGWKYQRLDPITKRFPSKIFNYLTRLSTGVNLHDFNCGFKCMKKEVAKSIKLYGELHRYLPALAAFKGFKVGEVKVVHRERKYGRSKFGVGRLLKGPLDLVTTNFLMRFGKNPLYFFGFLGIGISFVGFIIGAYLAYLRFYLDEVIGNRPLLILAALLIILGIQIFSTGLIGELLISRDEKSHYVVKEEK